MLDFVSVAFLSFAGSLALSPGPLNLISLMFGASRNSTRAAPFILGGAAGFGLVWGLAAASTDIMTTLDANTFEVIKVGVLCYFLWLAYGVLQAKAPIPGGCEIQHPGAISGLLLAFLNPQSWITSLLIAGLFLKGPSSLLNSAIFGLSYAAIVLAATTLWLVTGKLFQNALSQPKVFGLIRYSSAGILVLLGARII